MRIYGTVCSGSVLPRSARVRESPHNPLRKEPRRRRNAWTRGRGKGAKLRDEGTVPLHPLSPHRGRWGDVGTFPTPTRLFSRARGNKKAITCTPRLFIEHPRRTRVPATIRHRSLGARDVVPRAMRFPTRPIIPRRKTPWNALSKTRELSPGVGLPFVEVVTPFRMGHPRATKTELIPRSMQVQE